MKAPEKIYLPIVQGRTRKDIRYDATYFAPTEFAEENVEYIRKDALLKWLEGRMTKEGATEGFVGGYDFALKDVINKLNSM